MSPRHGADRGRVVADREVLVAALARGAAHLLDARPAVRPGRVAVQVAADVARARRAPAARRGTARSRSSGGHQGTPSARVDGLLVGRVRQRLERRDVLGGAGRAHERGAEALRRRRRRARPARPRRSRRPRGARPARSARRSAAARRSAPSTGAGSAAAQTTASRSQESRQRRDVAGDLAAERGGDAVRRARARGSAAARAAAAARPRGRAPSSSCASVFGPMPGHAAQPPGGRGLAQLLGRADAERAGDLDRALRARGRGSGPRPTRSGASSRSSSSSSAIVARLDELAQPRLDPRADPAQVAHPPGRARARRPATAAPRIVSAARRYARAVYGFASRQLEQRRERVEPVGDLRVVHGRVVSRECSTT